MLYSPLNLAIRFMIGFTLGIATVRVLAQDYDYSDFDLSSSPSNSLPEQRREEQGVYERMYPDVDSDGYNWDTNKYQDVEIPMTMASIRTSLGHARVPDHHT